MLLGAFYLCNRKKNGNIMRMVETELLRQTIGRSKSEPALMMPSAPSVTIGNSTLEAKSNEVYPRLPTPYPSEGRLEQSDGDDTSIWSFETDKSKDGLRDQLPKLVRFPIPKCISTISLPNPHRKHLNT